jgi:protein gp37
LSIPPPSRKTAAKVKFLSIEPLLGDIQNLNLEGIDWVVVGGESGAMSRQIRGSWMVDIRKRCQENQVLFFFKQWGGVNKKKMERQLEGRTWDEMPSLQLVY